jgi:hypothetical protein
MFQMILLILQLQKFVQVSFMAYPSLRALRGQGLCMSTRIDLYIYTSNAPMDLMMKR